MAYPAKSLTQRMNIKSQNGAVQVNLYPETLNKIIESNILGKVKAGYFGAQFYRIESSQFFHETPDSKYFSLDFIGSDYHSISELKIGGKFYSGRGSDKDPINALLAAYHDAICEYNTKEGVSVAFF